MTRRSKTLSPWSRILVPPSQGKQFVGAPSQKYISALGQLQSTLNPRRGEGRQAIDQAQQAQTAADATSASATAAHQTVRDTTIPLGRDPSAQLEKVVEKLMHDLDHLRRSRQAGRPESRAFERRRRGAMRAIQSFYSRQVFCSTPGRDSFERGQPDAGQRALPAWLGLDVEFLRQQAEGPAL